MPWSPCWNPSRRFRELRQDEAHLQAILAAGAQKARERAEKTLISVYDVVGFVPRA
jgi:tryptophanyl-tRNA synthetase